MNQFTFTRFASPRRTEVVVEDYINLGILNDVQEKLVSVIKSLDPSKSVDEIIQFLRHPKENTHITLQALATQSGLMPVISAVAQYLTAPSADSLKLKQSSDVTPSSKKIMTIDDIDVLLKGIKEGGDVSLSSSGLRTFLLHPSTSAVIRTLASSGTYKNHTPTESVRHFLTLAFSESTWKYVTNSASASGPMQIKPDTYRQAFTVFQDTLGVEPAIRSAWFDSSSLVSAIKGSSFNFSASGSDTTAAPAMLGHIFKMYSLIDKEWAFDPSQSGGTWRSRIEGATALNFLPRLQGLNWPDGTTVLMTAYGHGYNVFSTEKRKKTVHRFRYIERFNKDLRVFRTLSQVPLNVILQGCLTPQAALGDVSVSDEVAAATSPEVLNAYIAKKLGFQGPIFPKGTAQVVPKTGLFGSRTIKRGSNWHEGVDLRARTPLPVFAVDDGTIVFIKRTKAKKTYGNQIVLRTLDGSGYRYAHLSLILATPNSYVKAGQIIGMSGATGTYSPHLHFEYFNPNQMANNVNPEVETDPLKDPLKRWKQAINS